MIAAAGALYAGFPARVGLTRSQAQVSMPGDLILPTATFQADRVRIVADAGDGNGMAPIWPELGDLATAYEQLFDVPLELVYREAPDLMVWRTCTPTRDDRKGCDLFSASLAVVLRPAGGGTAVHVRERYQIHDEARGRIAAAATMTASAVVTTTNLGRLRRRVLATSA